MWNAPGSELDSNYRSPAHPETKLLHKHDTAGGGAREVCGNVLNRAVALGRGAHAEVGFGQSAASSADSPYAM